MKANEGAMLARVAEPMGEVVQRLLEKGLNLEQINHIASAMLPLVNAYIRLDVRLQVLERRARTDAQIRESRE